jgi:hypothetical protein
MASPGMPYSLSAWLMLLVIPLTLLVRRSLKAPLMRRRPADQEPGVELPEAA